MTPLIREVTSFKNFELLDPGIKKREQPLLGGCYSVVQRPVKATFKLLSELAFEHQALIVLSGSQQDKLKFVWTVRDDLASQLFFVVRLE